MKERIKINRGIYIAVNGLLTRQLQQDVAAENIANVNTAGYKKKTASFGSLYDARIHSLSKDEIYPVGSMPHGSQPMETKLDFSIGNIEQTDASYDYAIPGEGFFIVETPDGDLYTRQGSFRVGEDGFLVTKEGYYVIGEYDDYILVEDGEPDQELIIANPPVQLLERVGEGYYNLLDLQQENIIADPKVLRGFLEASNVDLGQALVESLEALRLFQINQRMLLTQDELLRKSASEIGSFK